jgi:hypothetical protein
MTVGWMRGTAVGGSRCHSRLRWWLMQLGLPSVRCGTPAEAVERAGQTASAYSVETERGRSRRMKKNSVHCAAERVGSARIVRP